MVDAAGVEHRGGLSAYRLPGASTVHLRGLAVRDSRLDPATTSLEITTADDLRLGATETTLRFANQDQRGGTP